MEMAAGATRIYQPHLDAAVRSHGQLVVDRLQRRGLAIQRDGEGDGSDIAQALLPRGFLLG
jgi:hypothetical protein